MRCVNIDWLECHCIEPLQPRDAEYFRSLGWDVIQRDYGTRVYREMFTLRLPDGEPFLEIRRNPVSANSSSAKNYFEVGSCHIRLHNRTCYFNGAARILDQFIKAHGYQFRRISRIDLCMDFEKFDSGDNPKDFLDRYLKGRYSKINQGNIRAVGRDLWDGRFWNSLAWGSPASQISTKFYNKTMEISECKDKPYIRQAWASCGLVDDFIQLTKTNSEGNKYNPSIWRLEFSIRSSVKKWFVIEHDSQGHAQKRSKHNTLDVYYTSEQILDVFASLVDHYFHFKYFEKDKRKDRCQDKVLFKFDQTAPIFKPEKIATASTDNSTLVALKARLQAYQQTHFDPQINKAIQVIIDTIDKEIITHSHIQPYKESESVLLQRLIAYRIGHSDNNPLSDDIAFVNKLFEIEPLIF